MPEKATRRPTVHDVARAAGISHATVSRYLNKNAYVSETSRTAIEAAIRDVNYVPNRTARSLVQQKTHCVAFIVREHPTSFFTDPNLNNQAIGASSVLSARDYVMLILIVDSDESALRITDLIRGGFVDGAILAAMHKDDVMVKDLLESTTPIVTASSPVDDPRIHIVDTDNVSGTRMITGMLRATGRSRVGEIRGPAAAPVSTLRHEGFTQALGERYDERLVVTATEWSAVAGTAAMAELLQREPEIDGVVAASDLIAVGAIEALQDAGRNVPYDVGVVGFDDAPWATQTRPPLSTVRQDALLTGRRMAEIVLGLIDGDEMTHRTEIIPNTVVWRESAGDVLQR